MKLKLRASGLLELHWQHKGNPVSPQFGHKITIISIDPGLVNYAFRVEDRYNNGHVVTRHLELIKFKPRNRYIQLTNFLDSMMKYVRESHIILVERQLYRSANASRMSQHTLTYFMLETRNAYNRPLIYEVSSKLKTKVLAESKPKNTKRWATRYANDLLILRGDNLALGIIRDVGKKKDDLCDTIVQAEASIITLELFMFVTRERIQISIVG